MGLDKVAGWRKWCYGTNCVSDPIRRDLGGRPSRFQTVPAGSCLSPIIRLQFHPFSGAVPAAGPSRRPWLTDWGCKSAFPEFTSGASAILELARQIQTVAGFTRVERGITVSAGVISEGSRTNVVAAEARAGIDVRVLRLRDAATLDRRFRGLRPVDRRCKIEISGGLNRPPMERTAGIAKLFRKARELAAVLGIELEESLSGGGSDGNFTAAVGAPTLDGLGAVGEGAHAPHESILVDRMADRAALVAKMIGSV